MFNVSLAQYLHLFVNLANKRQWDESNKLFYCLKDEGDTSEEVLDLNFSHLKVRLSEEKEDEIIVQTQFLNFFYTYSRNYEKKTDWL